MLPEFLGLRRTECPFFVDPCNAIKTCIDHPSIVPSLRERDVFELRRMIGTGAYVKVVTDAYAASPLALKLHESFRQLYK
jgi:hypothetical protein